MNINVLVKPKEELFLQEEAMDFKVNREIFTSKEVVYDTSNEQAIELDYILPDYYPEVFRVLKCQLSPRIVSHSFSGTKLIYEIAVGIRVLYVSENSNALNCVEQKMNFTKSLDVGRELVKPHVCICPKVDYINCRVVNQRRLDFRGAVTCKVKICCEKQNQIASDAFGANIQLKKKTVCYPAKSLAATKRATIIEDLEMGSVKPSIMSVVRSEAVIASYEQKVLPNKVIVKGEAIINMLYTCQKENMDTLEVMQFNVMFSQIVDVDGVNDKYDIICDIDVTSCEIIPRGNINDSREVECELILEISVKASKFDNMDIVVDAFSTVNPVKLDVIDAKLEKKAKEISETKYVKANLEYKEGEIVHVYSAWANVTNVLSRLDIENGALNFSGNCNFVMIGKNENNKPIYLESDQPFEIVVKIDNLSPESYAQVKATVTNTSYNLTSTNAVEVKADIKLAGYLQDADNEKLVYNIEVDESVKKERDNSMALKLYFADEGEDVWEIAKKYSTSIIAITEENELDSDTVAKKGMIMIPIVE